MVYDALGDMLHAEIHALGIQAKTPQELPNPNPTKGNA
jgi:stress-induced morphogen